MGYSQSKLHEIIRLLISHPGNASERLASVGHMILLISIDEIPTRYRERYQDLQNLIRTNIEKNCVPGMRPSKIHRLPKDKASKYIEFLFDLYQEITSTP